jgi:hypothetical protein
MGVDRCRPGRRRDRLYADPRQRRELPGWAAARLPRNHGWPGLFSRSSRPTVIAGAILLLACHLFTERPGRRAHR